MPDTFMPIYYQQQKAKFHFPLLLRITLVHIIACFRVKCWFLFLLHVWKYFGMFLNDNFYRERLCHYDLPKSHWLFCSWALPLQFDGHSDICLVSVKVFFFFSSFIFCHPFGSVCSFIYSSLVNNIGLRNLKNWTSASRKW